MLRQTVQDVVKRLNSFPWGQADFINEDAERLISEHVRMMRAVIAFADMAHSMSPNEAYAEAQSAGYDASGYNEFMDALFNDVELHGLPCREHIILTIASCFFWEDDHKLGRLENPWIPVMQLYEKGYLSTFEEDELHQTLGAVFFCKSDRKTYRIA